MQRLGIRNFNDEFGVTVPFVDLTNVRWSLRKALGDKTLASTPSDPDRAEMTTLSLCLRELSLPTIKVVWDSLTVEIEKDATYLLHFGVNADEERYITTTLAEIDVHEEARLFFLIEQLKNDMVFTIWKHYDDCLDKGDMPESVHQLAVLAGDSGKRWTTTLDDEPPFVVDQSSAGLQDIMMLFEVLPLVFHKQFQRLPSEQELIALINSPSIDAFLYRIVFSSGELVNSILSAMTTTETHDCVLSGEVVPLSRRVLNPKYLALYPDRNSQHTKIEFDQENLSELKEDSKMAIADDVLTHCPAAYVKDKRGFTVITALVKWARAIVLKHYVPAYKAIHCKPTGIASLHEV